MVLHEPVFEGSWGWSVVGFARFCFFKLKVMTLFPLIKETKIMALYNMIYGMQLSF